jgi:integrase
MKAHKHKGHRRSEAGPVKKYKTAVKIYEHRRYIKGRKRPRVTWQVAEHTSGVRCLHGFADYGRAKAFAERMDNQLARGQSEAATMDNKAAASYGQAIELLKPLKVDLLVAVSNYVQAVKILEGDDLVVEAAKFYQPRRPDALIQRTVPQAVEELITAKESAGMSDRYVEDLRQRLRRFAKDQAGYISHITALDIIDWLARLGLKPRSVNNFQGALYTLFSYAESKKYIIKGENPVPAKKIMKETEGPITIFTPDEMLGLLKKAPSEFIPILALGGFAGFRSAEIARMEWSEIDLTGGFIHLGANKAKTAERRLVPITPNCALWLAPYAHMKGKVWKGTENELEAARNQTTEAGGVPWKHNALRHSFVSYRVADIQNVAQVSIEAGNSPEVIKSNYLELVRPAAAKAWFSLTPEQPVNVVSIAATPGQP